MEIINKDRILCDFFWNIIICIIEDWWVIDIFNLNVVFYLYVFKKYKIVILFFFLLWFIVYFKSKLEN